MAYPRSSLSELSAARARGQRPDGFVVVGDGEGCAWATRNRFFAVDAREVGEDLDAFAGIDVLVRARDTRPLRELSQRLALTARHVTVRNTTTHETEFLRA